MLLQKLYRVIHDLWTLLQEVISWVFVIKKIHINICPILYRHAKILCHFMSNFATTFQVVKLDIRFVIPCRLLNIYQRV